MSKVARGKKTFARILILLDAREPCTWRLWRISGSWTNLKSRLFLLNACARLLAFSLGCVLLTSNAIVTSFNQNQIHCKILQNLILYTKNELINRRKRIVLPLPSFQIFVSPYVNLLSLWFLKFINIEWKNWWNTFYCLLRMLQIRHWWYVKAFISVVLLIQVRDEILL